MRRWTAFVTPLRLALAAVALAVILPVAWYLGSPLFITTTIDEAFPVAAEAAPPVAATSPVPATATPTATLPPTAIPVLPTPAPTPPTAAPAPPGPVALLRGQFTVIDALHRAEGTATIYRLADGQRVLRFEEFKSANGPGLFVYLSGHPKPRSGGEFRDSGVIELAPLKATSGNQNYALPPDLDLASFRSAVIYCKPFSVVFSTAELRSA